MKHKLEALIAEIGDGFHCRPIHGHITNLWCVTIFSIHHKEDHYFTLHNEAAKTEIAEKFAIARAWAAERKS